MLSRGLGCRNPLSDSHCSLLLQWKCICTWIRACKGTCLWTICICIAHMCMWYANAHIFTDTKVYVWVYLDPHLLDLYLRILEREENKAQFLGANNSIMFLNILAGGVEVHFVPGCEGHGLLGRVAVFSCQYWPVCGLDKKVWKIVAHNRVHQHHLFISVRVSRFRIISVTRWQKANHEFCSWQKWIWVWRRIRQCVEENNCNHERRLHHQYHNTIQPVCQLSKYAHPYRARWTRAGSRVCINAGCSLHNPAKSTTARNRHAGNADCGRGQN